MAKKRAKQIFRYKCTITDVEYKTTKKAKNEGLSTEETKERDLLREEYLKNFRTSFRQKLENIEIVDEEDLEKKN